MALILLFAYALLSNVAIALVPHEPVVIAYGKICGVCWTASVATLGTLAACIIDYRCFFPWISRRLARLTAESGGGGIPIAWFGRAPFIVLALSGLTPLPFWPFKALAFAHRYPLGRYLLAIALGRWPRYALLAWAGHSLPFPSTIVSLGCAVLFIALLLRSWLRRRRGQQ